MNKKGQGLPLNTIIIAIIVLVVLVVIIAIFTGRIVIFSSDLDKAASLEGTKIRAQLIGQNCVPSDYGIRDSFNTADSNKDGKLSPQEEATRATGIQTRITLCTGLSDKQSCNANVNCQWQGS